jgi:hypothetical protein
MWGKGFIECGVSGSCLTLYRRLTVASVAGYGCKTIDMGMTGKTVCFCRIELIVYGNPWCRGMTYLADTFAIVAHEAKFSCGRCIVDRFFTGSKLAGRDGYIGEVPPHQIKVRRDPVVCVINVSRVAVVALDVLPLGIMIEIFRLFVTGRAGIYCIGICADRIGSEKLPF